jgi:hypothetical protein
MGAGGGDVGELDRSLELDQRMGLVVEVSWASLAVLAEVRVVAHGALVANAANEINRRAFAERAITLDTDMHRPRSGSNIDGHRWFDVLVDRGEPVAGMDKVRVDVAVIAVVPVRTIQALVTHAVDALVAAVTIGIMGLATTGCKALSDLLGEDGAFGSRNEGMLGMVAMLIALEAHLAKIKVLAVGAVDKLRVLQLAEATVAGPHVVIEQLVNISLRNERSLGLARQLDSGAADEDAVYNLALDQPVVVLAAGLTLLDAVDTEVEVAIIACGAVIVSTTNGLVADIAAYSVSTGNCRAYSRSLMR